MFTDVVGFTASAQADEAGTLQRLRSLEDRIRPLLGRYGGTEVKSTGDGMLVEFESALKAVGCAIAIAKDLAERPLAGPAGPTQLRIGVHVGEVEAVGADIFGDAVNVAARVVSVAEPGGICISRPVHDLVVNKLAATFDRLPPQELKGVRSPPDLYRVVVAPPPHAVPSGGADGTTRLAVLPLTNISPDPSDEYFADGLTEELIAVLSRVRGLRVIARTSVNQYKGTTRSITQIGAELGVDSVLEGSVRKAGSRIRVTLQLIDAKSQEHTWAESYNREVDDVFAIQAEVAEKTAAALRHQLAAAPDEAVARPPTSNPAAYDAYLRGIHVARQVGPGVFQKADAYFAEATRLDPGFASAYSHWAHTYAMLQGEQIPLSVACPRAKQLVAKALELDPRSSDAHMAAGNTAMQCDHDWPRAEAEFRQAIELNPSNAGALEWYGVLLYTLRRYEEAKVVLLKAREMSPQAKSPVNWLAIVHVATGELEAAERCALQGIKIPPAHPTDYARHAMVLLAQGRKDEAAAELRKTDYLASSQGRFYCVTLLANLGELEPARAFLAELDRPGSSAYLSLARRAGLHAVLGDKDAAIAILQRDLVEGDQSLWFEYQYWPLRSVRSDPRFQALLRDYHLPPDLPAPPGPVAATRG